MAYNLAKAVVNQMACTAAIELADQRLHHRQHADD
jgi:hypothetical protein